MLEWPQTILNVNNYQDHENHLNQPKQIEHLLIQSAGRYTITLSRISIQTLSLPQIEAQVMQQYGLDEDSLSIQAFQTPQNINTDQGEDLKHIFSLAKVQLGGSVGQFKGQYGIGKILEGRRLVYDGNTIIYNFWDQVFQYVLLHQIKY